MRSYIVLCCLETVGITGKFQFTCSTTTSVEMFELPPTFQTKVISKWDQENFGYSSPLSPQFSLKLTQDSNVMITLSTNARTDPTGLIFFVFKDTSSAKTFRCNLTDSNLILGSPYLTATCVTKFKNFSAGNYLIVTCSDRLENKQQEMPFTIQVDSDHEYVITQIPSLQSYFASGKWDETHCGYNHSSNPQYSVQTTVQTECVMSLKRISGESSGLVIFVYQNSQVATLSQLDPSKKVYSSPYLDTHLLQTSCKLSPGTYNFVVCASGQTAFGDFSFRLYTTAPIIFQEAPMYAASPPPQNTTISKAQPTISVKKTKSAVKSAIGPPLRHQQQHNHKTIAKDIPKSLKDCPVFGYFQERVSTPQQSTDSKVVPNPIEDIIKQCELSKTQWTVTEFSLNKASLCENFPISNTEKLSRLNEIYQKPYAIIDGINPDDVVQGVIGNCWFCHLISGIARRPELIQNLIYPMFSEYGVYSVKIWDEGKWQYILIDDYFPVNKSNAPVFVHSKTLNETWVMLLEKAIAKYSGGYEKLDAFHPRCLGVNKVFSLLTGGDTTLANPCKDPADGIWKKLILYMKNHWIVGASTANIGKVQGLVGSHSYAVLAVAEIFGEKIIQLRNPWGKTEWQGRWGDDSPEWTSEIASHLHQKKGDDGAFYMPFSEFIKYFNQVTFSRIPEPSQFPFWNAKNSAWTLQKNGGWKKDSNPQFRIGPMLRSHVFRVELTLDRTISRLSAPAIAVHIYRVAADQKTLVKNTQNDFVSSAYILSNVVSVHVDIKPDPGVCYVLMPINSRSLCTPFTLALFSADDVEIVEM